jgi:hypothetical protein
VTGGRGEQFSRCNRKFLLTNTSSCLVAARRRKEALDVAIVQQTSKMHGHSRLTQNVTWQGHHGGDDGIEYVDVRLDVLLNAVLVATNKEMVLAWLVLARILQASRPRA